MKFFKGRRRLVRSGEDGKDPAASAQRPDAQVESDPWSLTNPNEFRRTSDLNIDPWLLPVDHPDWEPDSSGPGDMWIGTLDEPEEKQEHDEIPEWQHLGYPSYRAWWLDYGYMTLQEPDEEND